MFGATVADESAEIVAEDGVPPVPGTVATARIGVALAVASALNYLLWLGWDRERVVEPDGSLSGPYEAWQVVGLVAGLGILAVLAGRLGLPRIGTLGVAGVMWLCWSIDAAMSDDGGLWVVGAVMLLPAVLLGVGLVAFLAASGKTAGRKARPGE
ncbi:hypothetical protein [Streptosporangium sp. NPDC050280]|uniref:hypothetical protein n=1 Tax=unclassified Streptosporangium TaxID=2632669 RepID=UPI003423E612